MNFNRIKLNITSLKGALAGAFTLAVTAGLAVSPAMAQPFPEPIGPGSYNQPYTPQTWYVSANGNNQDGKSWATAWTDFDQIRWNQINFPRHDKIEIDGGAQRMVYRAPLRIDVPDSPAPFSISVSKTAGHNGQAVLIAPPGSRAVEIVSGPVVLDGSKRSGFFIVGGRDGVYASSDTSSPSGNMVRNIEIAHSSEAGIYFNSGSGYPIIVRQSIIHDCATNVLTSGSTHYGGGDFEKCWIYNSSYARNSDGFRQEGNPNGSHFVVGFYVRNSVIGPGLRDGVNTTGRALPWLRNCLLINATRNNLQAHTAYLDNVTSFMTRLNPIGMAHSAIRFNPGIAAPQLIHAHVNNSIVYGGVIDIPLTIPNEIPPFNPVPFPIIVSNNTQFRTTGNTIVLSPTMVDPLFRSNVGRLPNQTPIPILMHLDFSLQPTSPATGTGSAITSVRQLLESFQ